jgi:ketosteroid isomerase-like protein
MGFYVFPGAAYNKHDRAALGAPYTDDAQLMMHGAATIVGRNKIERFWAGDFKVDDPLTLLVVANPVQGSDMTLVHGNYQIVSRVDGSRVAAGRFAHIRTRSANGGWRLDRDLPRTSWFSSGREKSAPAGGGFGYTAGA